MPDLTLVLGDFTFADFEIPTQIAVGGIQQLIVHELVGGIRVVDAMGRRDRALEWSGWFMGEDALSRYSYLDAYRIAGKKQPLTWSQFNYLVLVHEFEPIVRREFEINYRIVCEVVADMTTAAAQDDSTVDVDSAINTDLTSANSLGTWA